LPENGEFGSMSCESIAKAVIATLRRLGYDNDYMSVTVSEDNEFGATVTEDRRGDK
jgi:glutaredoxin-related protein